MASLFTAPQFDGGGGITPEDGLKLSFFNVGTLVQKATFTTESLSIANSNPVESDANGVFPEIWMAESSRYKVKLEDKNDVLAGFGVVEVYIAGVTSSLSPPTANAGGSVDVITAAFSPAITLLTDTLRVLVSSTGPNTSTTPTFSPDGITAGNIVKYGNQALLPGDIAGEMDLVYNLSNNTWELLNPRIIDYIANAAGTVDVITASFTPAITSLVDKTRILVRSSGANTITNPTVSPNGLAAKTIVKNGNQLLSIGDTLGEMDMVFNESNDNWELLNPSSISALSTSNLFHIQDQKTAGTDGGTFTSGAWQTRDLNTVATNTISGASLSTNQITLPAGDYYVTASAPAFNVNAHKAKLRSITGSTDIVIGSSEFCVSSDQTGNSSVLSGLFTLSIETIIELQHRCSLTSSSNGFGENSGLGVVEVYSNIEIWKVG